MTAFAAEVAALLEKARLSDGRSYKVLAPACEVGHTRLRQCLTGLKPMTVSELERVCRALGLVPWMVVREAEETVRATPPALPDDVDPYTLAAQHEAGVSEDDANV